MSTQGGGGRRLPWRSGDWFWLPKEKVAVPRENKPGRPWIACEDEANGYVNLCARSTGKAPQWKRVEKHDRDHKAVIPTCSINRDGYLFLVKPLGATDVEVDEWSCREPSAEVIALAHQLLTKVGQPGQQYPRQP